MSSAIAIVVILYYNFLVNLRNHLAEARPTAFLDFLSVQPHPSAD